MTDRNYLFIAFSDPHVGRQWGAHAVPMTREKLTDRYLDPIREMEASEALAEAKKSGDANRIQKARAEFEAIRAKAAQTRAIVRAGRFMEKTNAKLTP